MLKQLKTFLVKNGISGILGLILGVLLLFKGMIFYSGICFGIFFTRNGDYIQDLINEFSQNIKNSEK